MILSLFTFIGWLVIIVFFLIPKSLTTEENIIQFFIINITIITIYTLLTKNLKLLESNKNIASFMALCIHRSIIIPLCLLTLMNLLILYDTRLKKITASIATILISTFIELLTLWTGVKNYTGWNSFMTVTTLIVLVFLFYVLTKLIRRIS